MTTDEQREGWSGVAGGWERRREAVWAATRPISERLVELLAPRPGETVLDVAAGPGDTGFLAAAHLGPSGRLVSSDFAPEMVDSARRRAVELELDNVAFAVLDAGALDLADESVDGVLCRWGFMLVDDPAAAFHETYRVLRPGGRVAFAVWGSPEENLWLVVPGRVLVGRELAPRPEPDAPGPLRLADRDRVDSLLGDAGFDVVVHEDRAITWEYESFDQFWETTKDLSRILQTALEALDPETVEEVRTEIAEQLAEFRDGDAIALPAVTQVVLARRPA
jgi:SAM-dependent methyltransferase